MRQIKFLSVGTVVTAFLYGCAPAPAPSKYITYPPPPGTVFKKPPLPPAAKMAFLKVEQAAMLQKEAALKKRKAQ